MRKEMKLDAAVADGLSKMLGHADANETALFTRQIEYIFTQTYDVKYPDLKARSLIPVNNQVNAGADKHTFRQYDMKGEAEIVHNYGDDFPSAEIQGKEFSFPVVSLGDSYQYSVQDLRAAAMAGVQLETRKALAARRLIENKVDKLACVGDPTVMLNGVAMTGISNAPDILSTSITTGGQWAVGGKTAKQILADVNAMAANVFDTTLGVFTADTLVLDTASYSYIATTQINKDDTGGTFLDDTILTYILKSSPWLKSVEYWPRLNTASSAGKARLLMYKRDPEVLELMIPQEFEQLPPQARNMSFVIPCHLRFGGVAVRYPKAVTYLDGAQGT